MRGLGKIVQVVRYTLPDGRTVQCMDSSLFGYDTLCGTDLSDPEAQREGTREVLKQGRVTCPQCLDIIGAVLSQYGGK